MMGLDRLSICADTEAAARDLELVIYLNFAETVTVVVVLVRRPTERHAW